MKLKRTFPVTLALLLAICLAITVSAGDMPTEPIGGKPPEDTKASFTNFDTFKDQVLYQRAFEAVLWSVPMVNKLGLRRGTLAIGGGDNVVLAWSAGVKPYFEALTPNNVSPYVNCMMDLSKGPVVVEVPPANDKAGNVRADRGSLVSDLRGHWPDRHRQGQRCQAGPHSARLQEKFPTGFTEIKSAEFPASISPSAMCRLPPGTQKDARRALANKVANLQPVGTSKTSADQVHRPAEHALADSGAL